MNEEKQLIYNEILSRYDFDKEQRFQIKLGFQENLNVSLYARPEFDWLNMKAIRLGLEQNLDVSIYAKPEFSFT